MIQDDDEIYRNVDWDKKKPSGLESYDPWKEKANGLVSTCASEIAIEPVEWIWPGRLAVGKHTCWAGEPGASKSTLTMAVAATVSMGGAWPCGEGKSPQGSVIILSAEDGAADTIVPRLHAAGTDLGSVHIVSAVREEKGGRRASAFRRTSRCWRRRSAASATWR